MPRSHSAATPRSRPASPWPSAAHRRAWCFATNDGDVGVALETDREGHARATLTSVEPRVLDAPPELVDGVLGLLGWQLDELDPGLPPAIGFAGVYHLILAVRDYATLQRMSYDFDPMQHLMLDQGLTTLQLIWRETPTRFRARDPFAVGGVVEDPATGAAAAALGAYLRDRGAITPPTTFEVHQGIEMGRPSLLTVSIAPGEPGIKVSGTAVTIPNGP